MKISTRGILIDRQYPSLFSLTVAIVIPIVGFLYKKLVLTVNNFHVYDFLQEWPLKMLFLQESCTKNI